MAQQRAFRSGVHSRAEALAEHLAAHRVSVRELTSGVTEALLGRLPPPPDGAANYELADAGRRAIPGLRIQRGRKGITFVFGGSIKRPDGRFKSAQVVLGRWTVNGSGMSLKDARSAAAVKKDEFRAGVDPHVRADEPTPEQVEAGRPITLRMAWELYKSARTQAKKKKRPLSPTTLTEYTRVIEVSLRNFADTALLNLADDPRELIRHFYNVSERTPAEANTQMRVVRAVWNRAHKTMRSKAPPPPEIFDMNEVTPREAGFVTDEVKNLWKEIEALETPLARKGAFLFLLTGLREGAALQMQDDHIDHDERTLIIPWTKGKLLRLPLSEAIYSLLVATTPEKALMPENPYVFPSMRGPRRRNGKSSEGGSIYRRLDKLDFSAMTPPAAYVRQRGDDASVHPHVFRHTYRTLATSAHTSEVAIRLLMGHSLRGDVSFDYLTADLTWLRKAQEDISSYILQAAGVGADFRFSSEMFSGPN